MLALKDPTLQNELLKEIKKQGYSVRQVEEMVKLLNAGEVVKSGKTRLKKPSASLPDEYNALKMRLSQFFKTKVQMTCSTAGRGRITIPFNSEEELVSIIGLFDKMKE